MTEAREPAIKGVVPAIYTPFKDDLSVDEKSLQLLADRVASVDGVGGVFCTGHAGEVAALSVEEQKRVVKAVSEAVGDRVPVLAGLYCDNLDQAITIARNSREAGASVITVFPPGALAGAMTNPELVHSWHETIIRKAGVKVCLFQFPLSSPLGYSAQTLSRLVTLPEVVAVKEGSGNPRQYEDNVVELSALEKPVSVLTSNNDWWLADLTLGGDGVLSGSGPVLAREQVEMYRAVTSNDLAKARAVQARIRPLLRTLYRAPGIDSHTRMKLALVIMGVLPNANVRPPLMPLEPGERKGLEKVLSQAGLLS
ncbi:dihydrodipicolinate synthase family protein [Mesorhizobium sp.]|uniref:dihydrodipicolinate synthase family protein n=1 Tax=Mesorhizobium sp. TaxID=1871066 RepID=UPI000FE5B021|nr:dihydrodipicolinate synthase family protein [Mesorhizobium sp.]RWI88908.1 MAG: dihydrodipicolinate synthase family protein [Mesorhizobium sp.]